LEVLGELGMIPCSVDAIKLSVGFWHHVVNSKGTSLIKKVYDTIINSSGWYSSKIKLHYLSTMSPDTKLHYSKVI
jgi:hypothetical protein